MNWKLLAMMMLPWIGGLVLGNFCRSMPYWVYLALCFIAGVIMGLVSGLSHG